MSKAGIEESFVFNFSDITFFSSDPLGFGLFVFFIVLLAFLPVGLTFVLEIPASIHFGFGFGFRDEELGLLAED